MRSGYYLDPAGWRIEPVAEGGRLPAGDAKWIRIPTAAALALVPILGATFLMFMPMIGFVLFLQAMASPVLKVFNRGAEELAATVSPGWQPGEAHFTGKSPESARVEEKGPTANDARLDALEKEIADKRRS